MAITFNHNDKLYVSGSNVGIGTASPQKPLHIRSANDAPVRVESTDATTGILFVDPDGSNALYYVGSGDYFYTSSKVGIGTTSPDTLLHIESASDASSPIFTIENDNDIKLKLGAVRSAAGTEPDTTFIAYDSDLRFIADADSTTEVVRFTSGGNVGIGKTDPSAPLHINGGSTNQVVKIQSTTAPYVRFKEGGTDVGFIQFGTDVYISNQKAGTLNFRTNNTDKMTILSGGNVGIGTTNPGYKLDVAGDIKASNSYRFGGNLFKSLNIIELAYSRNVIFLGRTTFPNAVANQAVNIELPNGQIQGYLKITLSDSYSNKNITGALTKLIPFGYNANNGIWGSGSNYQITEAVGGVATDFTIGDLAWDSTNSIYYIPIYHLSSAGNSLKVRVEYFGENAGQFVDAVGLSSVYIQAAPAPYDVRHYQNINDRLGIAIKNPGARLDVNSNISSSSIDVIKLSQATTGAVKAAASLGLSIQNGGEATNAADLWFTTASGGATSERMRITSGGNVAIGTTTANTLLSIDGQADNGVSIQGIGTTATRGFFGLDANGDGYFYLVNGGTFTKNIQLSSDLNVDNYIMGDLGIGTTGPSEKLDVNGGIRAYGYISSTPSNGALLGRYDSGVDIDSGELLLVTDGKTGWDDDVDELGRIRFYCSDGSGIGARDAARITAINGSGNGSNTTTFSGELAFFTSAYNANIAEAMRIDGNGNVGIGTDSPGSKLEVRNTDNTVVDATIATWNSNTTLTLWNLSTTNTTGNFIQYANAAGSGSRWYTGSLGGSSFNSVFVIGNRTASSTISERLRITAGGSVGINTTDPAGLFNVYGGRSFFAPSGNTDSGTGSHVIDIYNPHDTAFTADARAAYNAHTSWDINSRSSYTISSRPKNGSIYTFAGEHSSAAVAINRYVQFNSNNDSPLLNWTFYQYDGAGTAATDLKVPSKVWTIQSYQNSGSDTLLILSGDGSLQLSQYGAGGFKGDATYVLGVDSSGNVVEKAATYFGTNTGAGTYTNQWQKVLQIDCTNFDSQAFRLRIEGSGNTSAQSIVAEIEFNFKNQSNAIRARTTVNSYGTTPVDKDHVAVYFDTTNYVATFYFKVTENYTRPIYSIVSGYIRNYAFYSNVIGDDTALASETNDSITSNLKFQGITQDQDSGNVGIGTSHPDNKLMVQGASTDGASSSGNVALFEGPAGTNGLKVFVDDTENAAGLQTISGDDLLINPHGGNVGIGTSSPDHRLHVKDTATDIKTEATTGAARNILKTSTGEWRLGTNSTQSNNFWIYEPNLAQYVFNIDTSGNVGIGTTDPNDRLDVSDGNTKMVFGAASSDRPLLYFQHNAVPVDGEEIGLLDFRGYNDASQDTRYVILTAKAEDVTDGTEDGSLTFQTMGGGTATQTLTMRSGKVGIGTTDPNTPLHVVGDGSGILELTRNSGNPHIFFKNTSNTGYGRIYVSDDIFQISAGTSTTALDFAWIQGDSNGNIAFPEYGAGFLQTDANGNITTGTVTTSDTLDDVTDNGNSTTNSITVGGVTSTGGGEMQGGDLYFKNGGDDGAGTHLGNVWYSVSTGGGTAPVGVYESAVITTVANGTHGRSDLVFKTKDNDTANFGTTSEHMRITSAGNVGIGTTSPSSKLDVNGDISITVPNANTSILLKRDVSGTVYTYGSFNNAGADFNINGTGNVFINADSNSDSTSPDRNVTIGNRGVEYMRVTGSGNVGIGTTSPATLLHLGKATNGTNIISLGEASIGGPHGLDFYGDDATRTKKFSIYYRTGTENISMEDGSGTKRWEISQSGAVTFNQAFTFPTADGSTGAALVTNGSGSLSWNGGYKQYSPVGWGVLNNQTYTSTGSNISSSSTQAQAGTTPVQRNSATEFEATKAGWYEISYSFIVKNNYANRAMIGAYMTVSTSGGGGVISGSHSTQYVRYSTYGEYAQIQNTFYYYTSYSSTNFYLLAYLLSGSMNMTTQALNRNLISFRYINNDIT